MIKHYINKEEYIKKEGVKRTAGITLGGSIIILLLIILGFSTFGISWLFIYSVYLLSRDKKIKNYIKSHRKELEQDYEAIKKHYLQIDKKREQAILKGIPTCPHCASEAIEVFTDIGNSFLGHFEYGKPKMVCKICGKVFNPGE
jgi:hypothetical protein